MLAIRTISCQVSTSLVESCHCYRILVPRPRIGREICLGGNREWRILFATFSPSSFFRWKTTGKMSRSVDRKMSDLKKSVPTGKNIFVSKRSQSKILKGTYLTFKEHKLLEILWLWKNMSESSIVHKWNSVIWMRMISPLKEEQAPKPTGLLSIPCYKMGKH